MRKIKLPQGKFALVDNEDFEWLNQWKWNLNNKGYASRNIRAKGGYKRIYMHRLVNKTPHGFFTDHINRNKLDNRKVNLRTVSHNQNQHNLNIFVTNTSGFPGVSWNKAMKKWESYIWNKNKKIRLGFFKDIEQAYEKRLLGEKLYWI